MTSQAVAERVLVLAPLGCDAEIVCKALSAAGVSCETTSTLTQLSTQLRKGVGAAVMTEEALTADGMVALSEFLSEQPSWSDVPLVLLLAESDRLLSGVAALVTRLRRLGNVTLLTRPVPTVALVSAMQSALRARARQYEVRDLIERESRARLEAERANALKDEFLATVSHELRTPLSAIMLWSRLMTGGRLESERISEGLQAIQDSAELQSRLVEDLLDVSRMLSGKLQLQTEEIQLAAAAENALRVVQPMAQGRHVRIEALIDPVAGVIRADADRVQQVIWNLLGNAIKFTPAKGTVTLELRREGACVAICVTDTGQGIAADFLPHVFDRFRQADGAPGRRHAGLGLGLAITQQLVELHGGSISVESAGAGLGSTFTVRLPLADVGAADGEFPSRTQEHRAPSGRLTGQCVLLVEDDAQTRAALTLVLEQAGAKVTAVASSAAAMRELQTLTGGSAAPDVVLSDIGMPGGDGFALIRTLRDHERAARTLEPLRAVAISAYTGAAIQARAIASGFESYIAKPVNTHELIEALRGQKGRA